MSAERRLRNNKPSVVAMATGTHVASTRRKAAVVRILERVLQEAQDLSQDHDPSHSKEACERLVWLLSEMGKVVYHRLYLNPAIQYLYGAHLARQASHTSGSGESLEQLEALLTEAHQRRQDSLTARDTTSTALKQHLQHLDLSGRQAVASCREESRAEQQEVRANSESNLELLKADLLTSRQAMASQEARHQHHELELRETRQHLVTKLQEVIRDYDATMGRLQTRLDQLRRDHAELSRLLQDRQGELSEVQERYKQVLDHKQQRQQQQLAAMQAEFRREHAARTIQRAWQHYKMRKMLKKAQRKRRRKPKDAKT